MELFRNNYGYFEYLRIISTTETILNWQIHLTQLSNRLPKIRM